MFCRLINVWVNDVMSRYFSSLKPGNSCYSSVFIYQKDSLIYSQILEGWCPRCHSPLDVKWATQVVYPYIPSLHVLTVGAVMNPHWFKLLAFYYVNSSLHFSHDKCSNSHFNHPSGFIQNQLRSLGRFCIPPYQKIYTWCIVSFSLFTLILKSINDNYILHMVHSGSSVVALIGRQLRVIPFYWPG